MDKTPHWTLKLRALICPMLMNLIIGTLYLFSNLIPNLAVYLNASPSSLLFFNQIFLPFVDLGLFIASKLSDTIPAKYISYFGGLLQVFIVFYISRVRDASVLLFVMAPLMGLGNGLANMTSTYIAWSYFPKHKSLLTGVHLTCLSLSSAIFSPITTKLVNPNNLTSKDPRYGERIPFTFLVMAGILGSLLVTIVIFQPDEWVPKMKRSHHKKPQKPKKPRRLDGKKKPEQRDQISTQASSPIKKQKREATADKDSASRKKDRVNKNDPNSKEKKPRVQEPKTINKQGKINIEQRFLGAVRRTHSETRFEIKTDKNPSSQENFILAYTCPSMGRALNSSVFWLLSALVFTSALYFYFLVYSWKVYFMSKLPSVNDAMLSYMALFGGLLNGFSRIFIGLALQKIDFKYMYLAMIALGLVGAFTIDSLAVSYGAAVFYLCMGFLQSALFFVILPPLCSNIFGPLHGPKLYPMIKLNATLANFTQYFLFKFYGVDGNYSNLFYIYGGFLVLSIILCLILNFKPVWQRKYLPKVKKPSVVNSSPPETQVLMSSRIYKSPPSIQEKPAVYSGRPKQGKPRIEGLVQSRHQVRSKSTNFIGRQ